MKRIRNAAFLIVLAITAVAAPAFAQDRVEGAVRTISGDTLLIVDGDAAGKKLQLWGIIVPALDSWPEGVYARAALDALVEHADVYCEPETGTATP